MNVDHAFERLLGRQVTEAERARLYRVRDALHLGDNDALWLVLLALEHYDSLFRVYPDRLAEAAQSCLEQSRLAISEAAAQEVARWEQGLAERLARTSVTLASAPESSREPIRGKLVRAAAVVLFGAVCTTAGAAAARSPPPVWTRSSLPVPGILGLAAMLLRVPAGWMIFGLLLPPALQIGTEGWRSAISPSASAGQRAMGWTLVSLACGGACACAAALWMML